jgi:hypothetical protein
LLYNYSSFNQTNSISLTSSRQWIQCFITKFTTKRNKNIIDHIFKIMMFSYFINCRWNIYFLFLFWVNFWVKSAFLTKLHVQCNVVFELNKIRKTTICCTTGNVYVQWCIWWAQYLLLYFFLTSFWANQRQPKIFRK